MQHLVTLSRHFMLQAISNKSTAALQQATDLPPEVTTSHVSFGYEGAEPEVCFQQWSPSRFMGPEAIDKNAGTPFRFRTSEQYMM